MKRIVTLLLGVLLLSPGIVTAADRKTAQEPPGVTTATMVQQKLDLNRVSLEELIGVPGIGPHVAQAIIDLRSKKGSFSRIEELLGITGIKEKKLAALSGYLEVILPQTSAAATPAAQSK